MNKEVSGGKRCSKNKQNQWSSMSVTKICLYQAHTSQNHNISRQIKYFKVYCFQTKYITCICIMAFNKKYTRA